MKQAHSLQRQQRKQGSSATSAFAFAEPTRLFAPVPAPSAPTLPQERQERPAHVAQFRHSFDRLSIHPPIPDGGAGHEAEQSGEQSDMQQTEQQPASVQRKQAQRPPMSQTGELLQRRAIYTRRAENHTGLPDALKAGIESLSGIAMNDVGVHYNSAKPAQVGALAYTQGTEIHVGPGQEQHLPHEAWHVVQQKQGRVKPTMQMKGVAINDDDGLEREADVMGERAKTAQAGERVLNRSAKTSGEVQMKPVIQRAVGFEFQTGWLVEREEAGTMRSLAKTEPIGSATYEDFRLEADRDPRGGNSEIEFIIYPPIPESSEGLAQLQGTMDRILELGGRFKDHSGAPFRLNVVTNVASDAAYLITPVEPHLSAGPQVTLGLDLTVILDYLRANNMPINVAPGNAYDQFPKLKGLLSLMSSYLKKGLQDVDPHTGRILEIGRVFRYPKQIAEPLLARTDFVGLFNLIEPERRAFYLQNPQQWVQDVMSFAGLDISRKDEDILSRGFLKDREDIGQHYNLRNQLRTVETDIDDLNTRISGARDRQRERQYIEGELGPLRERQAQLYIDIKSLERHTGTTVSDWLLGILLGHDRLREVEGAGSMSAFGPRTEKVGPGDNSDAGIFEYRGAQGIKIQLEEWPKFAKKHFMLILRLHGHQIEHLQNWAEYWQLF